ncbi:MAG: hypothetical protein E7665_04320 [Ruminococcaceae bacterium]|nr:hypothetical protein [Oscillospiraceae bacterium]
MNENGFKVRKRKNNMSYTAALISLIAVTMIFIGALCFFISSAGNANPSHAAGTEEKNTLDDPENNNDIANENIKYDGLEEDTEVRGVWIATVANINFPSKSGLSAEELKKELLDIVKTVKEAGFNTIYFQARPCADALYDSKLFPVSSYLSTDGRLQDGFDPLKFIVDEAHKEGINVSAWINPYRVTYSAKDNKNDALEMLASDHIARKHPEWVIEYAGKLYFDPAIPEVRQYVIDGVKEIVENYDVDGIHIDDYFYPYPESKTVDGKTVNISFEDGESYKKYASDGQSLDDFRRENVNKLVKGIYEGIKSVKREADFGVSPFGIWANESHNSSGSATNGLESYYDIYCDPIAWLRGGYVDYICPQIYWSFTTSAAPFDVLVRWWSAAVDGMKNTYGEPIELRIGHGAYRVEEFSLGAKEFVQQVTYARSWMGYTGSVFYGYEQIKNNTKGIFDALKELYSEKTYTPAPVSTGEGVAVNKPANGLSTSYDALYVLGSSDPAYPVYYKGAKLSRTKSGYFSLHMELEEGENVLELTSNGNVLKHTVNRKVSASSGASVLDGFTISGIFPYSDHYVRPGDKINVLLSAPAGSTVTASLAGVQCKLSPTINPKKTSKYVKENYSGVLTVPSYDGNALKKLGKVEFTVTFEGETKKAYSSEITVIPNGCTPYIEVTKDYAYLKISPTSSFYDDYLNASEGMRDYIIGLDRGYYKLRFGGYIAESDVRLVENGSLLTNKLLAAKMENKDKNVQLRFAVTENVPLDVKMSGKDIKIILFNTSSEYIQEMTCVSNPLFDKVIRSYDKDKKATVYTLTLKDVNNYYGFKTYYAKGTIVFDFKSPEKYIEKELPLSGKRIIVDAGHGGSDGGAGGFLSGERAMNEADMNLLVSHELKKSLEALGAEVIMTRTDDTFYSLDYRMDFLNEILPDLCISVHHNSIEDDTNPARVRGYVGLYCNGNGKLLTEVISDSVTDELKIYERTPSYQKLAMCRNYKFPQTLLELGFMCSAYEYEIMQQSDYAERCASATAEGVVDYFRAQGEFAQ